MSIRLDASKFIEALKLKERVYEWYPQILEASYVVYKDDAGVVYAVDGKTGEVKFSGTDASEVIRSAINALPATGGKVLIKEGEYYLPYKKYVYLKDNPLQPNLRVFFENTLTILAGVLQHFFLHKLCLFFMLCKAYNVAALRKPGESCA